MSEKDVRQLFQAIGTYNRFRIIQMLSKKPLSMDEIAKELNISIPAVLKHLDALEKLKIVSSKGFRETEEGRPKNVYYLAQKVISKIIFDDEVQAIEFYRVSPKHKLEEMDLKEVRLRKAMFEVKLKRLERKRLKLIKELERLDRLEKRLAG
ncbi:MAG: ArsR/SmtB family transcription factor [Nitrososphaeria archaeon]